jgi:hypothetical protein
MVERHKPRPPNQTRVIYWQEQKRNTSPVLRKQTSKQTSLSAKTLCGDGVLQVQSPNDGVVLHCLTSIASIFHTYIYINTKVWMHVSKCRTAGSRIQSKLRIQHQQQSSRSEDKGAEKRHTT